MKATEQYFLVVPFIMVYKVVLTFESVDEILWCDHSNESHWANVTSLAVLSDVVSSFKAFYKMTIWNLAKLTFATFGSEKLNPCENRPTRRVELHEKKKGCPRGSEVSALRLIFYMYVAHHDLAVASGGTFLSLRMLQLGY